MRCVPESRHFLIIVSSALLSAGMVVPSYAQTDSYFETPWILQPTIALPGEPQPPSNNLLPSVPTTQPTAYSAIFGFATRVGEPQAPAYQFVPHASLDEVLTDNVNETYSNRQSDLISNLSLGFLAGADTPHISGVIDYNGVLQDYLHDVHHNDFSNFGYGTVHGTIVPGEFYINLRASADDVLRSGGGLISPALQNGNATQVYTISASPYVTQRLGDVGFAILRYQFGQAWFNQNTAPIPITPFNQIGPISDSTNQSARADIKIPGTLLSRLSTNLSVSASSDDTGAGATGDFKRALGEALNEYQLTRSLSAIGGIGYEALTDSRFTVLNGEGMVWDVGGRWQPNPDSSILILYGRHDLKSDIGGEIQYRFTPFTSLFASYSDSIQTSQNGVLSPNSVGQLNVAGPVAGITYDQNPAISTLNDASLAMAGDPSTLDIPLGLPLSDVDNFAPLENNITRDRMFQSILYSNVAGNPVSLTVYNVQNDSLTGQLPRVVITRGSHLDYDPTLSPVLFGLLTVGYNEVSTEDERIFNVGVGGHYALSDTLWLGARYDFILRDAHPRTAGYQQNAFTVSISKYF